VDEDDKEKKMRTEKNKWHTGKWIRSKNVSIKKEDESN
jgi:hypothetical protein